MDNCTYCYLLRQPLNGYTKIGISNDVAFRAKTLGSYEYELHLVQAFEFPNKYEALKFEKNMHKVFNKKRKRGEWFDLSHENIKAIIQYYRVWDVL
jgi:predicted GIY-YIG superfamily endonuclease